MSLDIWIESIKCNKCGHSPEYTNFNCTYNLSPMWYNIFPDAKEFIKSPA